MISEQKLKERAIFISGQFGTWIPAPKKFWHIRNIMLELCAEMVLKGEIELAEEYAQLANYFEERFKTWRKENNNA